MGGQRVVFNILAFVLAMQGGSAFAEQAGPSPADRAAAQALFDEGKKLESQEKWQAACAKFKESQRLEPAFGTQLNLARCYAKVGRTASAWITFLEAAATAKKQKREKRIEVAERFAAELEAKLVRLKVVVNSPIEGLTVKRGTAILRQAQWGIAVPVDPEEYVIEASAPGKKTWKKTVTVKKAGSTVVIEIPTLKDAPKQAASETKSTPTASGSKLFLGLGIGTGALALGGAVLGSIMSASAVGKRDESLQYCLEVDANRCLPEGVTLREDALGAATIATAGFVGAGVLAAASATFFVLHFKQSAGTDTKDEKSNALTLLPIASPQRVGLQLWGTF